MIKNPNKQRVSSLVDKIKEGEDKVGDENKGGAEVGRTVEIVEAVDKTVEEEGGRTEVGKVVAVKFNSWFSKKKGGSSGGHFI